MPFKMRSSDKANGNAAMVRLLQEVLGVPLNVSARGHFMGALGAALYALDHARSGERHASAAFAGKEVAR